MWLPTAANMKVQTDRQLNWDLANQLDDEGFNLCAQSFDAKVREIVIKGKHLTLIIN